MNHQVMISFDVDDKAVSEKIVEAAAKQVADEIIKECFSPSNVYDYYGKAKSNMSYYVKSVVEELLSECKEDIIHEAIADVVKNLHRTKQVKEALEEQL